MDPPSLTQLWSLSLCSVVGLVLLVQVGGDPTGNVARNGTATQSSDYSDTTWKASYAIDGDRNNHRRSCSSTKNQTSPWWRVDLLKVYRVTAVNITNRLTCCSDEIDGAEIHIGNSLNNSNNPRCDFISNMPAETTRIFPCYEMEGRYVSITISGKSQYLVLCEVEVYGSLNDSLAGNCSSTTSLPHDEYHFVNQNKTWTEAQSYCRENYTDLATINNTEDINRRMETGDSSFKEAWIGLMKNTTQGRWQWSDKSNCSFRNWDVGQPDNLNENQDCVVFGMNTSYWDDRNCDKQRPFFCYHDQLILIDQIKTWWEARSYCRQNHKDLVSVTSEQVQRWVEARVKRASTPHVWLGLRYSTFYPWPCVRRDLTCYHNWAPGNGTSMDTCDETAVGRFGAVQRDGPNQWVGLPDTEQLNFICSI